MCRNHPTLQRFRRGAALALPLLLLLATLAHASWRVVPIRIDLSARAQAGSVRVLNDGDTPLRLQMSAALWTQDAEGRDLYTPTEELIFFPRILVIPPGEERLVRAGIKLPAGDSERTYRLFLEQIPEQEATSAAQVAIAIRFGVPVFSAPLKPRVAGHLEGLRLTPGGLALRAVNSGNVNLQFRSLAIRGRDAGGRELFTDTAQG